MGDFRLPSLGADMEEGTIVEWLVAEGDEVHRGDIVAVVDTDKADIEVEVFESGVVGAILVPTGERVPVGTPLATIVPAVLPTIAPDREGAPTAVVANLTNPPADTPSGAAAPVAAVPVAAVPVAARPLPPSRLPPSIIFTPRCCAAWQPTSASTPTRSGERAWRFDHAGRHRAGRQHPGAPDRTVDTDATGCSLGPGDGGDARRTGAGALTLRQQASRDRGADGALEAREIPHYYVATQIDMTPALTWLREQNSGRPPSQRTLPAALVLRAVALSLLEVPQLNGFWIDDQFVPGAGVHLGVAVSLRDGGLVAPAIRDIDQLDVDGVMSALRDLVQRARSGRLRSSEMSDPTCTVTNLGEQGVDTVYGVIYPPQVAMVGLGSIVERPWASNGMLGVRHVVTATLSADHRATDGHLGARLLSELNERLQHAEAL